LEKVAFINFVKNQIEHLIKFDLGSIRHKYLVRNYNPFGLNDNIRVQFISESFSWGDIKNFKDVSIEYFHYRFDISLYSKGQLSIRNIDNGVLKQIGIVEFNLIVTVNGNLDKGEFSFDIIDHDKNIIRDYMHLVFNTYKKLGIYSFEENEIAFDGQNTILFFTDITRMVKWENLPFNDFNVVDDLIRCSQDIVFLIGEVQVYRSYISNFLQDKVFFGGQYIFRYFPTYYDKMYLFKCGVIIEQFYIFWDKVGDILSEIFDTGLKKNVVHFGKVIQNFPEEWKQNKHYKWLNDFFTIEYTMLNKKRQQVVHYVNIESDYHNSYQQYFKNEELLKTLQEEKEALSDLMIKHYQLIIKGFEEFCFLIKDYQSEKVKMFESFSDEIIVLGWGSLIWDPGVLNVKFKDWYSFGPKFPIEFARISKDGRLTLVINNDSQDVRVLYNVMDFETIDEAIKNLRLREDTSTKYIGFIDAVENKSNLNNPKIKEALDLWIAVTGYKRIIWTDLPSNFYEKYNKELNLSNVIEYIRTLPPDKLTLAKNYILKTPTQVQTDLRPIIIDELGWGKGEANKS